MSKSKRHATAKKTSGPVKASAKKTTKSEIEMSAERQRMISEAAYFLAEQRGFGSGDELGDWLQAESQVNSRLNQ